MQSVNILVMNCYDKAVSLLAMREHTEIELTRKLSDKGYSRSEIGMVIDRLKKENYLSEERFVENFVRSRMRKAPEGKFLLGMRLADKGSPREVYAPYLDMFFENEEHVPYVRENLEKLIRLKGREKAKLTLMKKGFRESLLEALMRDIESESDD